MKKLLAGVLTVFFLISLFGGIVSAQPLDVQDDSITVDGWGSYLSTGRVNVVVRPVCYFNREDILQLQLDVETTYTDAHGVEGDVRVYHWDLAMYTAGNAFLPDVEPVLIGEEVWDAAAGDHEGIPVYVKVDLGVDLQRQHSLFADATRN